MDELFLRSLVARYLDSDVVENAVFLGERLVALQPENEANLILLASAYVKEGPSGVRKAYSILRGAATEEGRYLLALCCYKLEKLREAEKVLLAGTRVLNTGLSACKGELESLPCPVPMASAGLHLLGRVCQRAGRFTQAAVYFRCSLTLDPFMWCSFEALASMGEHVDVEACFGKLPDAPLQVHEFATLREEGSSGGPGKPMSQVGYNELAGKGFRLEKGPSPLRATSTFLAEETPGGGGEHRGDVWSFYSHATEPSHLGGGKGGRRLLWSGMEEKPSTHPAAADSHNRGGWERSSFGAFTPGGSSALEGTTTNLRGTAVNLRGDVSHTRGPVRRLLPGRDLSQTESSARRDSVTSSVLTPPGSEMSLGIAARGPLFAATPGPTLTPQGDGGADCNRTARHPSGRTSTSLAQVHSIHVTPMQMQQSEEPGTPSQAEPDSLLSSQSMGLLGRFDGMTSTPGQSTGTPHTTSMPLFGVGANGADRSPSSEKPYKIQKNEHTPVETSHKLQRTPSVGEARENTPGAWSVPPSLQRTSVSAMDCDTAPPRSRAPALAAGAAAAASEAKTPNFDSGVERISAAATDRHELSACSPDRGDILSPERAFMGLLSLMASAYQHLCFYRCKEAIQVFHKLPPAQFNTGWVQQQIGRAYFEMSYWAEARQALEYMIRWEPHRLEGLDMLSTTLWHLHAEVDLCYLAQQVTDFDRLHPQTWCVIGNCFSLHDDTLAALRFFERAIQLDPYFAYPHTLCGHEHYSREDYDKAIGCYRDALRVNPRHHSAWSGLGQVYMQQEKYAVAEYHFRKALDINPLNVLALHLLSTVQQSMSKYDEALKSMRLAIKLNPPNLRARFDIAKVLHKKGLHEDALQELLFVRDFAPTESNVHLMLGKVYKSLGNIEQSMQHFIRAQDLKPKDGLQRLCTLQDENFDAEESEWMVS